MAQARSNYIEAGITVLTELGGGPISSKDLVKATQERGLIGTTQYVYHNFLRKLRDSNLFDTSIRGQVSLVPEGEVVAEAVAVPAALISEILSANLPGTESALDNVEDEEIDPDAQVNREF